MDMEERGRFIELEGSRRDPGKPYSAVGLGRAVRETFFVQLGIHHASRRVRPVQMSRAVLVPQPKIWASDS
jgi:hypothetical protein